MTWLNASGEMAGRIREHEWAATELGPIADWPCELRTAIGMLLAMPQPATIVWGPAHRQFYNDAYIDIARHRHPQLLGRPVAEGWADAYDQVIAPLLEQAYRGQSTELRDSRVMLRERDGRLIERRFDTRWSPVPDATGAIAGVLQTLVEVTGRRATEEALREREQQYRNLFEAIDEGYCVMRLVREDGGQITDLVFLHVNPAFERHTGLSDVVGKSVSQLLPNFEQHWIDLCRRVAETGVAERYENYLQDVARWFRVQYSPLDGVGSDLVAVVFEDITDRKHRELALQKSEERFRALVTSGTLSIYRMSPDWHLMYELDSQTLASTSEPIEDWPRQYIVEEDQPRVFAAIQEAIRSKSLFELEHRVRLADGSVGWVRSRAVPLLGPDGEISEWFGTGTDVTDRRNATERLREREAAHRTDLERQVRERTGQLQASRDLLQATMDSSMDMIQVFKAVRNGTGEIVDFRWVLNNHASESAYGEVRGESLIENNPGVVDEGIFETFKRVAETGEAEQAERHYVHEQFDGWYFQSVVKLGDGVATTTKEISNWKAAQAELLRLQDEIAQAKINESEARLAAVFEALPVGVHVADVEGHTLLANAGLRSFLSHGLIPSGDRDQGGRWQAWDAEGRPIKPSDFPSARALRGEAVVPGMEMLYTADDGQEIWTSVSASPVQNSKGEVIGQVGVIHDIDALKRNSEALRQSEERFRQFGEASQDVLWIRDAATMQWQYLTPAFEAIYGLCREEALSRDNYRSWLELILPEDRVAATDAMRKVRAGEHVTFEYRIKRPGDGAIRWLRNTDFPITTPTGEVTLIGGIGEDITEAKLSRQIIEQNEERLRSAVEVGRLGLWDWNVVTGEVHWSDEHFRMQGYAVGEVAPSYEAWLERIHPDDREAADAALHHARDAHEEYVREFRVMRPDGSIHWLYGRGRFIYDEGGDPIRMVGAMIDITQRHEAVERQKVLLAELQHRVRNILAVIRSIVMRSDDGERSTEDYVQHLQGRISALARTQVLLTRKAGAGVDLEEMIRDELLAQTVQGDHVEVEGPDIELSPKAAEVLTLSVHELATNATKYGAFAHRNGRLHVHWDVETRNSERWLVLHWVERGVPIVDTAPRRSGFGTELISRRIPYELKGEGSFTLKPGGVESCIAFPLRPGDSILQPNGVRP